MSEQMAGKDSVIRIKPNYFIHVLDNNSNVTRVMVGPRTFTRQEHEKIVSGPDEMVTVPPRHFCKIGNPVIRDKGGNPVIDELGQVRVKFGDEEIRFNQDPFPLFPNETLKEKPQPLTVVQANQALRLKAVRDFEDTTQKPPVIRCAGDEWLFRGAGTYFPVTAVTVAEKVNSIIIKDNEALKLRAHYDCEDQMGARRVAGEQWLVRQTGAYLPEVKEEVQGTVKAVVLTPTTAIHLMAVTSFKDIFGRVRKAGQEWLVTLNNTESYIPDIYEVVKGVVKITTLNNRQYCIVQDPIAPDGMLRLGQRELRKGECSFFLHPGERLESGIQDVYVLGEDEALLICSRETWQDGDVVRKPGHRWMVKGPCDFIPNIEVDVVEKRRTIPLDENEGIYVRNISTGKVTAVIGTSYMLHENEELWPKPLNPEIEALLRKEASRDQAAKGETYDRNPTAVVRYRVPHNAAVQVFDYISRTSRVVFGPELVLLGPDEHFTTLNLSGGIPKKSSQIQSIAMFLGPDFMTDQITVETADHARLSLKLSYNWHFELDLHNKADCEKIFSTPDFVGDLCKALSSRVRGVVAQTSFDSFHKHSVDLIQESVFGRSTKDGSQMNDKLLFASNNLVVTNIDIQSVEPVDQRTRDALQKSVQQAIDITTRSQEATARHEAERLEQQNKGRLERQKMADEIRSEDERKALLELQAHSAAVESTGQAMAEAQAIAQAALIEARAQLEQASCEVEQTKILEVSNMEKKKMENCLELAQTEETAKLEVDKAKKLAEIESDKFAQIVGAIGPDTLRAIAQAGPDMQQKLLSGLGLSSVMITDGNSPINLFNTAQGLVGGGL